MLAKVRTLWVALILIGIIGMGRSKGASSASVQLSGFTDFVSGHSFDLQASASADLQASASADLLKGLTPNLLGQPASNSNLLNQNSQLTFGGNSELLKKSDNLFTASADGTIVEIQKPMNNSLSFP